MNWGLRERSVHSKLTVTHLSSRDEVVSAIKGGRAGGAPTKMGGVLKSVSLNPYPVSDQNGLNRNAISDQDG